LNDDREDIMKKKSMLWLALALAACSDGPSEPPDGGDGTVASVIVAPSTVRLGVDATAQLEATARDASGDDLSLTGRTVTWSSSDAAVVTVDDAGGLTATGAGTATVTVDVDGVTASAAITVIGWAAMSVGSEFACGTTTEGAGLCWGTGFLGALGGGSTESSPVPASLAGGLVVSVVDAGSNHVSCALGGPTTGPAYCWGSNQFGQIGDGTIDPGAVAPKLSPTPVQGPLSWRSITVGFAVSCGVAADGGASGPAYCWGSSPFGLGDEAGTTSSTTPLQVSGVTDFTEVEAGYQYACGVASGGAAWCWGQSHGGNLGYGSQNSSPTPVAVTGGHQFQALSAGSYHACGVTGDGTAYCWGDNDTGQLGIGSIDDRLEPAEVQSSASVSFESVAAGDSHTCAVSSPQLYCWGANDRGQLGTGSVGGPVLAPALVSTPTGLPPADGFESVSAGFAATCAVTVRGRGYCWGAGDDGQIGNNGTTDSSTPVRVPLLP
jgi:alpha-tubulin suppressor-like RCC1 family protein